MSSSSAQDRQRRRAIGAAFALAVLLSLIAGGCRDDIPQGPARHVVAERLTQNAPLDLFATDLIADTVVGEEFLFNQKTIEDLWRLDRMEVISFDSPGGGVVFRAAGQHAQITAELDLEAEEAPLIEIDGEAMVGKRMLYWSGPGQSFSSERSIVSEESTTEKPLAFFTAAHPLWRGKITRIRLHPTSKPDHTLRLRALRAVHRKTNPKRLERCAHQSWQLTLGEETRPCRLAIASEPVRWEVDVLPGDRLEFAAGLQAGVPDPVRFQVWISGDGVEAENIWDRWIDPSAGEGDTWFEAGIDLPIQRAARLAIDLSVITPDTFDATLGLAAWGSPRLVRRQTDGVNSRKPNVLLISIDTLRSDHLSLYGYPRDTSPNLESWFESNAVLFGSVVASAPWTLPSHISMLSGIDAVTHGVNHGPKPGAVPLITDRLADAGFSTIAVTGGGFMAPRFGINAGFDSYRSHLGQPDGSRELEEGMAHLISWLESHREHRFFAFFHTYEVHGPYRPRQPYFDMWSETPFDGVIDAPSTGFDAEQGYTAHHRLRRRDPGEAPRFLDDDEVQLAVDCYDAGIAYTDSQLGLLFAFLKESGLAETTAVIITSDHGEALGEKGLAGHAHLYDFNVLVPLLISVPGYQGGGRRIANQVGLVDVAPTILDMASLPPPSAVDGASLLPLLTDADVSRPTEVWSYASKTNYGLALRVDNRVKYIFNNTGWQGAQGREELYLLDQDQAENINAVSTDPMADELRERARRHLEERQRGLLITIENRTDVIFRGELSTDEPQKLIITKIKAAGDPDQTLTVIDGRTVGFAVRAQSRLVVVAENIHTDTLRVTGVADDPLSGELDSTLQVSSGTDRSIVALQDGRWVGGRPPGPQADVWVSAAWRHQDPPQPVAQIDEDPEVLRQLQALGYVDE